MVQVLTVSATTAGYVADSIKAVQRPSRKAEVEQAVRELARKTGKSDDDDANIMANVVQPPALSSYFLTAGQHQNPQATLEEVIEAYEDNKGRAEI
ncbi:hypothetical protein [Agrobacterium rubi]|uniref:Uncharacterized protein n=2 Tax=Agrobacterium rubi TaxID=28099 RepID=A0AAE7ULM7_9HYPH|nr:hypothetical protein [Agrobacterium rubi]MBP1877867.1 hypothetical protein [Agrobacterium rubi]MCL6651946.1 hypothetical protein [Agrobacterium rubi]NTE86380.1 hypothetical protein [Agrobacterium rubi]NTF02312.1 hypothetical protein [Agrobacterium rubi]NTF36556.1 hypothetical protein [Agrobacterium rubi]